MNLIWTIPRTDDDPLSPNPPMRRGLSVGTEAEGHGSETVRA